VVVGSLLLATGHTHASPAPKKTKFRPKIGPENSGLGTAR